MSRRLLSLFIVVTLGMTPQGWGTEPEVTPIIRFGNPADAAQSVNEVWFTTGVELPAQRVDIDFEDFRHDIQVISPNELQSNPVGENLVRVPGE